MGAQIPGNYVKSDGDDLTSPLSNLLTGLGLLGTGNETQTHGLSELKEGALGGTKWVGTLAGGAGVAGLATAIVSAFTHAHEPTRVTLIAGGSIIATACVIAVALVVRADVHAHAWSAAAQYEARSQISAAFLALAGASAHPRAAEASDGFSNLLYAFARTPASLLVRAKNHDKEMHLKGVRRLTAGGEVEVRLDDGDWVPISTIETFHADA